VIVRRGSARERGRIWCQGQGGPAQHPFCIHRFPGAGPPPPPLSASMSKTRMHTRSWLPGRRGGGPESPPLLLVFGHLPTHARWRVPWVAGSVPTAGDASQTTDVVRDKGWGTIIMGHLIIYSDLNFHLEGWKLVGGLQGWPPIRSLVPFCCVKKKAQEGGGPVPPPPLYGPPPNKEFWGVKQTGASLI